MKQLLQIILSLALLLATSVFAATADKVPRWAADLESGCAKNQMPDCLALALAYLRGTHNGRKIDKNSALARQFGDRALQTGTASCQQGNLKHCYMVALLYFEGEFVTSDFAKSVDFARKSCVGGYKEACEWLKNSGV